LLLFVDGLGWGADDPAINPCLTYGGGRLAFPRAAGAVRPIDATLGVDGVPQSATGQTSLFCGLNAQAAVGGHVTGFPGPALRALLREHSGLKRACEAGLDAVFVNAFRPAFFGLSEAERWRLSASTVAALASGRTIPGLDALRAERAVYQEFTNRELVERGFDAPVWTPEQAGRVLAREALRHDFSVFEYFQTDRAGHARDRRRIERILADYDAFLGALLDEVGSSLRVVLTSDHGNLEDLTTKSHTGNPVPLAAWGPGAEDFVSRVGSIDAVVPALHEWLVEHRSQLL
jgi:hypothetical protein